MGYTAIFEGGHEYIELADNASHNFSESKIVCNKTYKPTSSLRSINNPKKSKKKTHP